MTKNLKSELGKQIKKQNIIKKKNELRNSFSEAREMYRELTAQKYGADNMLFMADKTSILG